MVIKLDKVDSENISEEDITFFNDEFSRAIDKQIEDSYLMDLRDDANININSKILN
jgi:hypothetical protein